MRHQLKYALIGALLLPGSQALAQSKEKGQAAEGLSLEDLLNLEVVSASKRSQKLSEAPATIYVITEDDIKRYGFRDLKDALKIVPGMEISDPDFFLFGGQRGFASNFSQTLLMVNGREMQNLLAAESFISHQFRMHNVSRVEVIQGPASALYGANAYVGVINIITKVEDQSYTGTNLEIMGGSHSTRSMAITFAKKPGQDLRVAGHMAAFQTSGEDFSDFIRDEDKFWRGNGDIASGARKIPDKDSKYPYANPGKAYVGGMRVDFKNYYAGIEWFHNSSAGGLESVGYVSPTRDDQRQFRTFFIGTAREIKKNLKLNVEINRSEEDIESRFPLPYQNTTTAPDGTQTTTPLENPSGIGNFFSRGSTRHRIIPQLTYDVNGDGRKVAIVGVSYEMLKIGYPSCCGPNTLTPPDDPRFDKHTTWPKDKKDLLDQTKTSAFAQYQHGFTGGLSLTIGGRYDKQSVYGSIFNPRSGLVYNAGNAGNFKLLYGQAFREPNVFELLENQSLTPAKMKTVEASHSASITKNFTSNIVVYQNAASSLLRMTTVGTQNLTKNTGERRVTGAEASFNMLLGDFRGLLNGSYAKVEKDDVLSDNL